MNLKAAVEKYLEVAREFGRPMPLAQFGLHKDELEAMVSAWDEDYHLHRHFELIPPSQAGAPSPGDDPVYLINGVAYTAIVFQESIRDVLQ